MLDEFIFLYSYGFFLVDTICKLIYFHLQKKLLLFDVDGTICDSGKKITSWLIQ